MSDSKYTYTGTVMSKTYGVAKKARAVAVRVLDSEGKSTMA